MPDTRIGRDPNPLRLYAIIRVDLGMNTGKIAAQSGHAYVDTALLAMERDPSRFAEWKQRHGIKICLRAKSLHALLRAHEDAQKAGLPCALIEDLGFFGTTEELAGKPTITALGIGPARQDEIAHITKRMQILTDIPTRTLETV